MQHSLDCPHGHATHDHLRSCIAVPQAMTRLLVVSGGDHSVITTRQAFCSCMLVHVPVTVYTGLCSTLPSRLATHAFKMITNGWRLQSLIITIHNSSTPSTLMQQWNLSNDGITLQYNPQPACTICHTSSTHNTASWCGSHPAKCMTQQLLPADACGIWQTTASGRTQPVCD